MTQQINRRTVTKGIAWSVPAVAVAGAAPAFAVSKPPIEIDFGESTACKIPGSSYKDQCYDKGYVLWGVFTNNTTVAATVTISGVTVGGITRCIVGLVDYVTCTSVGSLTFTIAAGTTRYIAVYTNSSTDSSSTTVTVSFDYTLTGQLPASSSQSGDVGGSPWQGSCAFPPNAGDACNDSKDTPISACGTSCASGTTVAVARAAAETTAVEEQTTEQQPAEDSSPEAVTQEPAEDITVESPKVEETPVAEASDAEATGVESTEATE